MEVLPVRSDLDLTCLNRFPTSRASLDGQQATGETCSFPYFAFYLDRAA
jgi:hypothetical protein